jgi:hypothetical protein
LVAGIFNPERADLSRVRLKTKRIQYKSDKISTIRFYCDGKMAYFAALAGSGNHKDSRGWVIQALIPHRKRV